MILSRHDSVHSCASSQLLIKPSQLESKLDYEHRKLHDRAGHQREMSLCEMMKYATVNPVRAIAPRTRRSPVGNGLPATRS